MCAVIPRLHQVNQLSFLSVEYHFSQLAGPGNLVTRRSSWMDVEEAVGAPGRQPPSGPGPYGPAAAAARVRSERRGSLQPARCSLCAS